MNLDHFGFNSYGVKPGESEPAAVIVYLLFALCIVVVAAIAIVSYYGLF